MLIIQKVTTKIIRIACIAIIKKTALYNERTVPLIRLIN